MDLLAQMPLSKFIFFKVRQKLFREESDSSGWVGEESKVKFTMSTRNVLHARGGDSEFLRRIKNVRGSGPEKSPGSKR